MVFIHEFRVPLPMEVEEFRIAQLFMVLETSESLTGNGEGVEILKNEPYDNTDGHLDRSEFSHWPVPRNKGQYTLKRYYIQSHVPKIVAAICAEDSMVLIEEAWNAYPHCTTVLVNGYLSPEKFFISVETMHLSDCGKTENAVGLSAAEQSVRTIETLDIAVPLKTQTMHNDCDPSTFVSSKTQRGPLQPGWIVAVDPVMTCYRVVRANFAYWGLQRTVERVIRDKLQQLTHSTLSQAFCGMDRWYGLTINDIRCMEKQIVSTLNSKRNKHKLSA